MKNLKKIKGDASFRKFFRKRDKKFSSIIVFSRKEKLKNLLIYDAINKILHEIPNIALDDVPVGKDEKSNNCVISTNGLLSKKSP